jgi:hypothetical protein
MRIGGVMVAVPTVLHAVACGGDDDNPDAINGQTSFGITSDGTGAPHSHVLTIQCGDLDNTSDVAYTSSETNGHTHVVTVTPEQLGMIATGATVSVSVTTPHMHTWQITRPVTACT